MALAPERSGSLSSVYLVLYFVIGALGTALAAPLLDAVGWRGTAVTALGALLAAVSSRLGLRIPQLEPLDYFVRLQLELIRGLAIAALGRPAAAWERSERR